MLHVFLLPWKYIVYVYIEFDYTDYTRCLAVFFLFWMPSKFKTLFHWKVCTIGEKIDQHLRKWINLNSLLWFEVKQCICIGKRNLTPFLKRRDTAKLLIYRYPTFTNWISRDGFRDHLWTWWLPHAKHHWESKPTVVFYKYYYWQHCCWYYIPSSLYKWISDGYIEKD